MDNPFAITLVPSSLLISTRGVVNSLAFQAINVPNVSDMIPTLGGTKQLEFTPDSVSPTDTQDWFILQLTGTVDVLGGADRDSFRPQFTFDTELTLTITSDGIDSSTVVLPCFIMKI